MSITWNRRVFSTAVALLACSSIGGKAAAQSSADTVGIKAAALDYIDGWYQADGARMEREGMIDEYRLVLCPVVLGNGRPLFRDKAGSIPMKLVNATTLDRGAVSLIYSPRDAAG